MSLSRRVSQMQLTLSYTSISFSPVVLTAQTTIPFTLSYEDERDNKKGFKRLGNICSVL